MRLTTDQIRLLSAFQSLTGVYARDCIIGEDHVVFLVDERYVGKAVGKNGSNVKKLQDALQKRVDIVGFSDDVQRFLKNIFHPAHIVSVEIEEKNGKRIARVQIDKESERILKHRINRKIRIAKELLKRYINIDGVVVT